MVRPWLVPLLVMAASSGLVDSEGPRAPDEGGGVCSASEEAKCASSVECTWSSAQGVTYSTEIFSSRSFNFPLQKPRGAQLNFHLCSTPSSPPINCHNGRKVPSCIRVPGVDPSSAGTVPHVEQIEPHAPGRGFKLIYEDGDVCQVTKKPRRTVVSLPCAPAVKLQASDYKLRTVFEGDGGAICNYFAEFPPSHFGCPKEEEETDGIERSNKRLPELLAVSGCTDSAPLKTTSDCHYAIDSNLTIHGTHFDKFCAPDTSSTPTNQPFNWQHCSKHFTANFIVSVDGMYECKNVKISSPFELSCTLEKGLGAGLTLSVVRRGSGAGGEVVATMDGAVTYKEAINFRQKFSKFVELGVGGLKKEIDELYRRAFASRGTSPSVLEKLGVTHIKGILLYGPPGAGKTLLARTIARIMGTDRVKLINGPEIISKYLGESEKNLRAHFKDAHDAWEKHGALSELHVIIIDEIDAICKPRGKADQSAAGVAYDALVNQLLTLMDGLTEVHNTLVVGLTNRRELLDPALLRPGRFEVQIEVGLPDEDGRWEIFEIHTRSMRSSSMLASDVNLRELAANTTRFSGAEISGVVRAAASYALERYQLGLGGTGGEEEEEEEAGEGSELVLVTAEDFNRALLSVNPAYTHSESHVLSSYLPLGYLPCGEPHGALIEASLELIATLKHGDNTRLQTLLLYGPRGSGKTSAAIHLATQGRFSFVRVLTASDLIGRHDLLKVDLLYQAFNDAFKSDSALVVLDDLQRLVEFVTVGTQISVSHSILHTLNTLLTATPPLGSKVMVIGTMRADDSQSLEDTSALGLPELFTRRLLVPLLDRHGALAFIAARNIHKFGGGHFSLPSNLEISMQQLVHALECACVLSHAHCGAGRVSPAHLKQDHVTECIMTFVTRHNADISSTIYGQ